MRALVQLAQVHPVHHTVPHRAGHQGVLGARDRAQQQRARLHPAQVVPVALLGGVHREQVERPGRHQPEHLRPLQIQPVQPGAVDPRTQRAEGAQHQITVVRGRHLTAP